MQQHSWARSVAQELGAELSGLRSVGGGCIHNAWQLQLADGRQLFAKSNRAALLPVLEAEADGLAALAAVSRRCRQQQGSSSAPQIPEVLQLGQLEDQAVLVLSWLELGGNNSGSSHSRQQAWSQLGAGLARLHRSSLAEHHGGFGWHRDNFIGSGPQPNGWQANWGQFFAQQRLGAQLQLAEQAGRSLPGAAQLLEQVPHWLAAHPAEPCLVHGDLWSGNADLLAGGGGALFDPAIYRGDREVDLAMAQLFGGFPEPFFSGYGREWPLPAGHRQRRQLYNLYHLLNHANLFGGGYWQQSAASIRTLLRDPSGISPGTPDAGS